MNLTAPKPEFCPNPACTYYDRREARGSQWYSHFGRFYTRCRGWITRFRCRSCGKTCSTQTFSVHYWTHSTNDLNWLAQMLYSCGSLRQIGRFAGYSYRVIQNRVRRLARNSLSVMDAVLSEHKLDEDLAMDGFESYTRSQYHPNNFTSIVGSKSQFFYAVIHTLMRRKGAMKAQQKRMRGLIDVVWKPPQTIGGDCITVLSDLAPLICEACSPEKERWLYTDLHPAYPAALRAVPELAAQIEAGRLKHLRISSRAARTVMNPLFPVNYLDRQMRKNMGEHVRETVKQGREVNGQMERMAVFMHMHNFLTPHRIDDTAWVGESATHASEAGVESDEVEKRRGEFLTHRHLWGHCVSNQRWIEKIWQHLYENPPVVRMRKKAVVTRSVALPPRELAAHFLA